MPRPRRAATHSVAVVLGLIAMLAGCSGDDDFRDADGRVIEPAEASVFELQVGDCLDPGPGLSGEVDDLPLVPCDQPHTQELYSVVTHPDDSYPGATDVAAFADGACLTELEAELDLTLDDGVFISYMLPTFDGWNTGGDRQILCVLVFPDRESVTGSFMDGTAEFERLPPATPQEPSDDDDDEEAPDEDVTSDASGPLGGAPWGS